MVVINEVRNAVSLNDENTMFEVEINHPAYGWIPYTLTPWDEDNTINNEELLALIGSNYRIQTQEEKDEQAANIMRGQRDLLLSQLDLILSNPLRWNEMTQDQKNAWSQYRTDLLNVPQQVGFPHDINWPTSP